MPVLNTEGKVIFNSRDLQFKSPTGAVPAGSRVRFQILAADDIAPREAKLVVEFDKNHSIAEYPMKMSDTPAETDAYKVFEVSVRIYDTGLYWYHFSVRTDEGWLQAGKSPRGNRAVVTEAPASWQQTVYHRKYLAPEWLYGGVFYHIFVDRFCHSGEYLPMEGKVIRKDWGGTPEYRPNAQGKILNNDFFGGNLRGIIEKLPYLERLGVTCLYLSPIFSAYSNHKYDTSDYMKIDPMFGTEGDFRELCEQAHKRGMHVILDGVFSHTGSESVYFDRYGKYGNGAWNHPDSPYRSWYYFHSGERYETWWGIETLPRINKDDPGWIRFICGENGVARRWLRAGADGWRLDVADELPNHFLKTLARAVKKEKPDALLLGEVWEDASSKISYDERKNYFEGDKLDSVMNYPFRNAVIDYIMNGDASLMQDRIETILENYPPEVVHCLMNILGTHDTVRILTALGENDLPEHAGREQKAGWRMDEKQMSRALRRLKMAVVINMTLPGVPCVFYGDEAGMEGFEDPFCRRCYPWGHENKGLQAWYRKVIAIRRTHRVYTCGHYRSVAASGGMYAFERYGEHGETRMVTAANCGGREEILILAGVWRDLLTGLLFRDNITVFPGEVLLLENVKEEGEDRMGYNENYDRWLASEDVDAATKNELRGIADNEEEIRERFTSMLNFGTAGLRGIMRAGLNGMNVYTVRYTTQGLANLINTCGEDIGGGVAIAYDSRNHSPEFAREAASVLAANDIPVSLFDELRPTPELSFAIRETGSIAGINITASHNTKEYNGYKVYWADGAQLPPEHAAEISAQLEKIDFFSGVKCMDFQKAQDSGLIRMLGKEMDEKYLSAVLEQSAAGEWVKKAADSFAVVYTPFHGSGYRLVPEVLKRDGLKHIITVPEQMVIDGDFPTVKSPNPEFTEGFAMAIELAEKNNVDLIIGTDPDGDRCGVCVKTDDGYQALTGNQIGVLLLDFLIEARRETGTLAENSAVVKSIVSTSMANRICEVNHIKLFETLTGFKYIGEKIKEFQASGERTYLFGFEESNGYLAGTYARDKDAVVASMLVAEMACRYKEQKGMNLYQALLALYEKYGYYREAVKSHVMEGLDGKEKMDALMAGLRESAPEEFGGIPVVRIRDYETGVTADLRTGKNMPTGLPESNVLYYELEDGSSAVIRPSGTEPKVKLYIMVHDDSEEAAKKKLKAVTSSGMKLLQG
jgi:phosphomannomutase/glycosidase